MPRDGHLADGRARRAPSSSSRRIPVRPRLVVVGAVEVARTLVRLAAELGYETVVIDGRAAFATEARFPDVDRLIVAGRTRSPRRSASARPTRSRS